MHSLVGSAGTKYLATPGVTTIARPLATLKQVALLLLLFFFFFEHSSFNSLEKGTRGSCLLAD
jgi:hypothetical protein